MNFMEGIRAKDIMIEDVATIGAGEVVVQAMLKMVRQGIGGLPVVVGEKVVGIITHRDVILLGTKAARFKVEEVMSQNLETVNPDTPLSRIVDVMLETGYQRLPVVEDGRLVGIVTQSSVIGAFKRYKPEIRSSDNMEAAFTGSMIESFVSDFEGRISQIVTRYVPNGPDDELLIEILSVCKEISDRFQITLSYLITKKYQTGVDTNETIEELLGSYLRLYDSLAKAIDWSRFPMVSEFDLIWNTYYKK